MKTDSFVINFVILLRFPLTTAHNESSISCLPLTTRMTKNLKVAKKGWDMSELGLTAINVQVDKVRYSVGFWSRCPFS